MLDVGNILKQFQTEGELPWRQFFGDVQGHRQTSQRRKIMEGVESLKKQRLELG